MIEQEEMEFCGNLCLAATRMGIGLRLVGADFQYQFADMQVAVLLRGERLPDKKKALVSACLALQNYLTKT